MRKKKKKKERERSYVMGIHMEHHIYVCRVYACRSHIMEEMCCIHVFHNILYANTCNLGVVSSNTSSNEIARFMYP